MSTSANVCETELVWIANNVTIEVLTLDLQNTS